MLKNISSHIEERHSLEILEKLRILSDAAKYDVACTSSGVDRAGRKGSIGNTVAGGICHSFGADGRCISLLKILMTNECVYDCKYCVNRISNDRPRTSFTPEELATLTISLYRRNYIEGLFLSSGVNKSPDYTMEQMYQAVYLLRKKYHFNGYIHVKSIPGADPVLIEKTGWLADRMSANLELPTAEGLKTLAPQKSRKKILTPIRQVQLGRKENMDFLGIKGSADYRPEKHFDVDNELIANINKPYISKESTFSQDNSVLEPMVIESHSLSSSRSRSDRFVPAGQSSQMIVGAGAETDYEIVHVAEALYQNFDLKRVFYSAFINTTGDSILPDVQKPDMLREHRLYQADFLLRFYQFDANEIITEDNPNLNTAVDPKCNWALNHLEQFPMEIQTASFHDLLRIPGIGVNSAKRIVAARKTAKLTFTDLKRMGIVLKRATYFITCNGKSQFPLKMNQAFILSNLLGLREKLPQSVTGDALYEQLSLLDTFNLPLPNAMGH